MEKKPQKPATGVSCFVKLSPKAAPLHSPRKGGGLWVQSQLVSPRRIPRKRKLHDVDLAWQLQETASELLARVDEYDDYKHKEAQARGKFTDSEEAMDYLYEFARHLCQQLERLAAEPRTAPLFKRYGRECAGWPCLVGVTSRGEIARLSRLKNYLAAVGKPSVEGEHDLLNFGKKRRGGFASPFLVAAQELHCFVLALQADPKAYSKKRTRWIDAVCKLPPLSKGSAAEWWKLMKVLLDEQWNANPSFEPLVAHLPTGKGNVVPRARAIDNSFRVAFMAYAKSPRVQAPESLERG
jgi:hypothetical protein